MLCLRSHKRPPSLFAPGELNVTPSPALSSELILPAGTTVVDFDIWPTGADAVILLHDKAGNHVVSWHVGDSSAVPLLDLPATFNAASLTVHPLGQRFFIEGKTGQQSQILAVDNVNGSWTEHTIYQTSADVRRLLVAPRPFETGYNDTTTTPSIATGCSSQSACPAASTPRVRSPKTASANTRSSARSPPM